MQLVKILINFVVRTVFIHMLGEQAVGLNGLFTNILSLLSLTELGFGGAIIAHMYKPIAEGDTARIKVLMRIYRTIYNFVAILVALGGIIIFPVLPLITRSYTGDLNVSVIFFLYVLNVVSSYLLGYKSSILTANQRGYVVNFSYSVMLIFQALLQITALSIWKSFYMYLLLGIICTVVQNVYVYMRANHDYPYIRKLNGRASKSEIGSVLDYVKPLMIYQVSGVVNNSTDSIIISQFLSLRVTGLYANYMMIVSAVQSLMNSLITSVTATIGNIFYGNAGRTEESFYRLFEIAIVLATFVSFCLSGLLNVFIGVWLGSNYDLGWMVSGAFAFNTFVTVTNLPMLVFREATGSFVFRQYIPVVSLVINLVLSMALVDKFGVGAVVFSTTISRLTTYAWNDPSIIFRRSFGKSAVPFIRNYYLWTVITGITLFLFALFSEEVAKRGLAGFFLDAVEVILIAVLLSAVSLLASKKLFHSPVKEDLPTE